MNLKKLFLDIPWVFRFILYGLFTILVILLFFYIRFDTSASQPQASSSKPTVVAAFPGAEGFGALTPGGRYGNIIFVSNLNDTLDVNSPDYDGSLRWAIEHTWMEDPSDPYGSRRIILFKVGGVIELVDNLILKHPFVTIAGQTAPGDGITLAGSGMIIATHDVIVRGIRVRVGDRGEPTCCLDGINISTHHADSDVYNVIVDHNSVSWAIDENMSTWIDREKPYTAHDITIQWNIVSEGLHNSIHLDEGASETDPHSMGVFLGQDGARMTVHHNLFAFNWARNPRVSGIVEMEIINNVVAGWGNAAVEINSDLNLVHILDNYFKATSNSRSEEVSFSDQMHSGSGVYLDGNVTSDARESTRLFESRVNLPENFKTARDPLFASSSLIAGSAQDAYDQVLNFAGAISPFRDIVDQRIVDQVRSGDGTIIDSQDQVGGWPIYQGGFYPNDSDGDGIPNEWEMAHGLNPSNAGDANSPDVLAPDGYSWIEEYVNSLIPLP